MLPASFEFKPPFWIRPAMVQTGLASLKFRKSGYTPLEQASSDEILTTKDGVKLKAVISDNDDHSRPICIIIHGWEGSSESTYVVAAARRVYAQGCSVVRLNLRDHGETHALNEGAFYATLFDEVFDAISMICQRYEGRPVMVTGFSLGGNYTLRIARRLVTAPIDNLAHLVAVSPVIDPPRSNPSLDDNKLIKSYFLKKWKRSMRLKQAAFPDLYDFTEVLEMDDIMAMTNIMIGQYTEYPDAMTYFGDYAIKPDDIEACPTPVTIMAADDDPVVPMEFCRDVRLSSDSQLIMWAYGGHNGFFKSLTGPTAYDDVIEYLLKGL